MLPREDKPGRVSGCSGGDHEAGSAARLLDFRCDEAGASGISVVDQGQVFVSFGVLDFMRANRVDLAQGAVLQSAGGDVIDGIKDLFPGSAERLGGFFPRKAARQRARKSI